MQYIYIVLFLLVSIIIMIKKQNISFLLIYFLSSTVFYFNAFEGKIFLGKLNQISVTTYDISGGFYIILFINMMLILLFSAVEKENLQYIEKNEQTGESTAMKMMLLIVLALSLYMCIKYKVFFRTSYNKSDLANATGRIATYYKYLSAYVFVYMFSKEKGKYSFVWVIISTIPILTTFLFGNRSYLVIALVAILFDKVYRDCEDKNMSLVSYIKKHKTIIIGSIVLVVVTLVIKGVTHALFTGRYDVVKSRLTNWEYYKQVFFVSEPNTISRNLDTIVRNNYQVFPSTYIALWAYFIPFFTGNIESMLGVTSFTKTYQKALYIDDYNNASSYLGEAFANGGYISVFFVVTFYLLLLSLIFRGYRKCKSNVVKTAFLLMGIDAAFYVQRNSLAFEFSRLRVYIYIAIAIFVLIGLINKKHAVTL